MQANTAVLINWNDPATGDEQQRWMSLPATIGRSRNNALVINSSAVSRQHAQISLGEHGIFLEDLNSTNGTYLNGKPVDCAQLSLQDSIHISPFTLTFSQLASIEDIAHELETNHTLPALGDDRETRRLSAQELVALLNKGDTQDFLDVSPEGLVALLNEVNAPSTPTVTNDYATQQMSAADMEIILSEVQTSDVPIPQRGFIALDPVEKPSRPNFPAFWQRPIVKIEDIRQTRLKVEETTYLSVGGGMGSFIWVDHLRIFGVPASKIVSIGFEPEPYGRYRRLCRNSQIPDHERLRSDSGSTPDNIWGYPGYAVREFLSDLGHGRIFHAAKVLWQIFAEPTFAQTFTPLSGRVYDSIDREAKRIGWDKIWRGGRAISVRKTDDGRYAVLYTRVRKQEEVYQIFLTKELHLAVGYPGFRLLGDLTHYREQTGDFQRVVNAYEDHDQIYEELAMHGGTVMIRGRGIVASRIIQKIYELRHANPDKDIKVINLMRSPLPIGHRFGRSKRLVEHHWEFQPFNWPKAAWGGSFRDLMVSSDDANRDSLLNDWGGTTTADRRDWRKMVNDGLKEGWYTIAFGAVSEVIQGENGQILTIIRGKSPQDIQSSFQTDFVVDCTGLNASLESNPFLLDLMLTYQLPRNVKGRVKVNNSFEIPELRNGKGHVIAIGAMTFGNGYAPVDSFLGLQYTCTEGIRRLRRDRAPHLKRMTPIRSLWQWGKWVFGFAPN